MFGNMVVRFLRWLWQRRWATSFCSIVKLASPYSRLRNDAYRRADEFRLKVTRKLSSGQSTRLGLAKAFLTEPKILFLDEPTASLDPDIAQKIRSFLKEERRSTGLSVLYT